MKVKIAYDIDSMLQSNNTLIILRLRAIVRWCHGRRGKVRIRTTPVQLEFHGVCTTVFAVCRRVLPQRARLIGVNYSACSILKSECDPFEPLPIAFQVARVATQQPAFCRAICLYGFYESVMND